MSQPEPPQPQPQPQPESTADAPVALPEPAKPVKNFRARLPRVTRRRGAVLGVAVLLAAAAATGTAAVVFHDHGGKGDHGRFTADHRQAGGGDGRQGAYGQARGGHDGRNGASRPGGDGRQGSASGQSSQNSQGSQGGQGGRSGTSGTLAPAPLPTVSATAAIEAAGKAVPGSRTEALRVVAEQGGGSAWEVEVLGTDGVRHLVTIDGATGTVTGNTVAPATSDTTS
ncbi:PepSY domain-containing protein [Streptomyces sp. NPDC058464]|uniref:PepSY domain-containing protein n=1 Tax=Streptomyces sp. NPDC058464 TaxID=3346511 RepID=UPI00365CBC94